MSIVWAIHLLLVALYSITIIAFTYGWLKTKPLKVPHAQQYAPISILIALRNEELNVPTLINCLNRLDYPSFEVIFINDHSNDNTFPLLNHYAALKKNFSVFDLPNTYHGKKAAINKGLELTKGELIVLTDADCSFHPEWLQQYNTFYQTQNKPDMIVGLVDYASSTRFLQYFFRLDFLSLVVSSAGATALKSPMFNNAANYAFRKDALNPEPDTNDVLASGDDVFRLHDFKARNKNIVLLKSKKSIVTTSPPSTMKAFLSQRTRWASKANNYSDPLSLFVAYLVFMLQCSFIIVFTSIPFSKSYLIALYSIFVKMIVDYALFFSSLSIFSLRKEFLFIPLMEVLYPFYIVYTSIMSQKKPFTWKGRTSY